jgi:hypothetical protein
MYLYYDSNLGPISVLWFFEELDGPAVSTLRRAIAEAKQRSRRSVIGWVIKKLVSEKGRKKEEACFGF